MPHIASIVLVLSLLLAFIALSQPLARAMRLPHTVLLAIIGVALGLLSAFAPSIPGFLVFGGLLITFEQFTLGEEAILTIFLPMLLFQTGLGVDVRRAMDDFVPILTLAVIAVIICTFAVGLALWPIAPVGLVACLLLGAVVATTDPVAVIGIFRDLGAPRRLLVLVEGESLFNDAAAIVLFTVLLRMLSLFEEPDWLAGALLFVKYLTGGVVVGYLGAWAATFLFQPLRNMPLAEITITVALAYLLYIVSERYLAVSGVVATVTAALVITSVGRTRITPGTWTGLRLVWDQIGYWAASLIFLFAAIQVPLLLRGASFPELGFLAVLTLAAFGARAVVLWGLLPGLTKLGLADGVDTPYKVVMLWGGLRGAVTLVLALSVAEHPLLSQDIKSFVTVLATGFVLVTLLVNATTLRMVMRFFHLDRLPPEEAAIRNRAVALARDEVSTRIGEIAKDYRIDAEVVAGVSAEFANPEQNPPASELDQEAQVRVGLLAVATREEQLYRVRFEEGRMSRRSLVALTAKAGNLSDAARGGADSYLAAAADTSRAKASARLGSRLHRLTGWQGLLSRALADRFEQLALTRLVLDDLAQLTRRRLRPLLGTDAADRMIECLSRRMDSCDTELTVLRREYPDYSNKLGGRFLRQAALRLEEGEYRTLLAEGLIGDEIYRHLDRTLYDQWLKLGEPPELDLGLETATLVRQVPLFQELPEERLDQIAGLLAPHFAYPGEELMRENERGSVMYFISSGEVEILRGGRRITLGRGDFFGEMALLHNRGRTATARAIVYSRLLSLSQRDFQRLLKAHPDLRAPIEREAERRRHMPDSDAG